MSESRSKPIDAEDEEYVRAWFIDVNVLARAHGWSSADLDDAIAGGRAPAPTYVLPDGTRMVPADYFALFGAPDEGCTVRERFDLRYTRASAPREPSTVELDEAWAGYLSGGFGACLKDVSPESMLAKAQFIDTIEALLAAAQPSDEGWMRRLRAAVDGLDGLEKPFAAYDRVHYGGPVSRDRFVTAVRNRYLIANSTASV